MTDCAGLSKSARWYARIGLTPATTKGLRRQVVEPTKEQTEADAYEPFGDRWRAMVARLPKTALIEVIRKMSLDYRSEHERAERLEKALKVYSYPKDYEPEFVDVGIGEGQRIPGSEPVLTDGGRAARAALADEHKEKP